MMITKNWKVLCYTFWLLLICNNLLLAQDSFKELVVPLYGQETNKWCWAACIKMIMEYHDSSTVVSQCELAKRAKDLRGPVDSFLLGIPCCQFDCSEDLNGNYNIPCDDDILEGGIQLETDEFDNTVSVSTLGNDIQENLLDALFWERGFISMELVHLDSVAFTWDDIVEQIDECRPFILIINPGNELDELDQIPADLHAVVAKGYHEIGEQRYIIVNDPWLPCVGNEFYLPYNNFNRPQAIVDRSDGQQYLVNEVKAYVHTIHPQRIYNKLNNATSCEAVQEQRTFYQRLTPEDEGTALNFPDLDDGYRWVSLNDNFPILPSSLEEEDTFSLKTNLSYHITNNNEKIVGYRENKVKLNENNEITTGDEYFETNVYYFSPPLLLTNNIRSGDFISANEIKQVTYKDASPSINSIFQLIDDTWELREINTHSNLDELKVVVVDGDTIQLSNLRDRDGVTNFDIYKFPPYLYEFYGFEYDGEKYFVPANEYGGFDFTSKDVISENELYRELRNQVKCYDRPNFWRRLWDFLFRTEKYYESKIN